MDTIAKISRTNRALKVIENAGKGMTIVEACKDVGLPRTTFYDICKRNPQLVLDFRAQVEKNYQIQALMILMSQRQILDRIIEDGLDDATRPAARVAVFKALNNYLEILMDRVGINDPGVGDVDVKDLLSGPVLHQGTSRFSAPDPNHGQKQ
ncbi:MAG: hypothetical protein M1281_15150 [Chloroflexi bacterium]|nr:hypothetical protein [Chloroflexota bacterium]